MENTYRLTCVIAVEVEIVAVAVVIVEDMMIEEVGEEMTDEEAPRFGRTIDAEEIDETAKDEEILVLMVVVTRDGKILTSP